MATYNVRGNEPNNAQLLMNAVGGGIFVGNSRASKKINTFALEVRRHLHDIQALIDERGPNFYDASIETVEELIKALERAMKQRTDSQISGISGNLVRIGGTLAYTTSVGKLLFSAGCIISSVSDIFAKKAGKEMKQLSERIDRFLEDDSRRFRELAQAIRRLDLVFQEETEWSIFDDEYQEFLTQAAEDPENVQNVLDDDVEEDVRDTVTEIARNRNLLNLLRTVFDGMRSETVVSYQVMICAFNAIGCMTSNLAWSAGFQVGELAVRGLELVVQYKTNKITLEEYKKKVTRLKMQKFIIEQVPVS